MRRFRNCKILSTLGPSSTSPEVIEKLFLAGVDTFRLNFSHGTHQDHQNRYNIVREIEKKYNRPIGILADMQGPKLRIGKFEGDKIMLKPDQTFILDQENVLGSTERVSLFHPEIYESVSAGTHILLDDGKVMLTVTEVSPKRLVTKVAVAGALSNNKGFNVPNAILKLPALTEKDKTDLKFALDMGADWIAISFVQRPEDVIEARGLIGNRARLMSKVEKPAAIDTLAGIVEQSDAIMVARGDLGVEMPAEKVPSLQKKIVRACRKMGKPVVVATQMLDSMVSNPTPTRAEASDVATAVFDGADCVMLSNETAAGQFPVEAVEMMNRIIYSVEQDPLQRAIMEAGGADPDNTVNDTITRAASAAARQISAAAIISLTSTGRTTKRAAKDRPVVPIISLTDSQTTARQLSIVWGVHSVVTRVVFSDFEELVNDARKFAVEEGFAKAGEHIVVTGGIPFGQPGTTNTLRVTKV